MKKEFTTKVASVALAGVFLFSSCGSSTMIQSSPGSAKLYLNGETVGNTPYTHRDSKIVGSTTSVKIEKEGYETLNTSFSRNEEADVGAIIGGIFFLFPFLWTMKYKPSRTYELIPIQSNNQTAISSKVNQDSKSKVEALRDLKTLLDENVISEDEYEVEKKKILD